MIRRNNVYLWCFLVTMAMLTMPAAAVDYTWIGGTSGSAAWDNPANWDPTGYPWIDYQDVANISDVLAGDRDITTPSSATSVNKAHWTALGGYEDRLTLGADFSVGGLHQTGWYNRSGDSSKMVLDLNGHTFTSHTSWFLVPDITVEGPGTFLCNDGGGVEFATVGNSANSADWTTPVFGPEVTFKARGSFKAHGRTIPNLGTSGDLGIVGGVTVTGDLTADHRVNFASGLNLVKGDVNVKAGDVNAGLYTDSGVTVGMSLEGDITDTNTEQNGRYNSGRLIFVGGGNVQTLDIRRQSGMRLIIDPCSYVLLGSDYYAPYSGTYYWISRMDQAAILDVGRYDLTLTDFDAKWTGDYDEAPIFKYEAGSSSGSISIIGDDTGDPQTTGLNLARFKVEITDGGGWTGGDDFILFDYDVQGSRHSVAPDVVSISLPSGWTYDSLVHDTSGKRVYLSNLEPDSDGDGVVDSLDICPDSDANFPVDENGCPDADGDGVADANDLCGSTPPGTWVEPNGCAVPDSDGDGVFDPCDDCPGTAGGEPVNGRGCPDTDGDGVADNDDLCPNTPADTWVDPNGCAVPDSDGDGVFDPCDDCPGTQGGVTVDENGCVIGGMRTIPRGTAVVDGFLDEWTGAEWMQLDALYYGDPDARDVPDARFTARWDEASSTIYVAAVVTDNDPCLTDDFGPLLVGWDDGDRIEILSVGDGEATTGWMYDHDVGQEYVVGVTTTGGSWAAWGSGEALDIHSPDPCLIYAARMAGNQYIYEAQVVQYDNYGGFTAEPTVVTDLSVGHVVRFEVIANTRHSAGFGMKALDANAGKYDDSGKITEFMLVEGPVCGDWGYLKADFDLDCDVDGHDFAVLAANWQRGGSAITGVVVEGAQLTELYSNPANFFEGPCWDPVGGKLYFCDTTGDFEVLRLDGGGVTTVWMSNPDFVNGTFIANDGRMITAEVFSHKVMSYQIGASGPQDPAELLYEPTLKQPNDLCQTLRGDIYFSDPDWAVPANSGVYRRDLAGVVTQVISDMGAPNGLIASNDGTKLYVADSTAKHIRSYPINPADGTVGTGILFFDAGSGTGSPPDGMTIDQLGNVYMAGLGGVWVISPAGVQLEMVNVPEATSNVTFGGPDNKTLFITCQDKVYSLRMQVASGR